MRPHAIAIVIVAAACGRVGFEALGGDALRAGDGAAACPGAVGHDEDGDGIDDACDNCPTVANPLQENVGELGAGNAADAVGDACDPNPAMSGDVIAFFDPLLDGIGLTTTGITGIGGDIATLGASSSIGTTAGIVSPTAIVVDLTVDGSTAGGRVSLTANSSAIGCSVLFSPCQATPNCFSAYDGVVHDDAAWGDSASSVTQIELSTMQHCILHATTTVMIDGPSALFSGGDIGVETGTGTGVTVTSIIAYGR